MSANGGGGGVKSENNKNSAQIFSSLLLDQINFQDVNAVLESQSQM